MSYKWYQQQSKEVRDLTDRMCELDGAISHGTDSRNQTQ